MRNNPPNRPFRAALVIVTIVLGAGSLSLARMFHMMNLIDFGLTTDHFQFAVSEPARSTQAQTASAQDSYSQAAPAWLTNALPGYSSSRAREMWYLSLNRAGDRE